LAQTQTQPIIYRDRRCMFQFVKIKHTIGCSSSINEEKFAN